MTLQEECEKIYDLRSPCDRGGVVCWEPLTFEILGYAYDFKDISLQKKNTYMYWRTKDNTMRLVINFHGYYLLETENLYNQVNCILSLYE